MEEYNEFVGRLMGCLAVSGLDYAFTGALAVSFYGSPRTTSDIDIIVAVGAQSEVKKKLMTALQCAGVKAEERKIDQALASGFKIASFKDKTTPYTIDIIFQESLEKQTGQIAGVTAYLQKPEALINAKLRMIKATIPPERATKDKEDIQSILAFTKVDLEAVKRQAKKDKTTHILDNLTGPS